MSDDFLVESCSNNEVRSLAKRAREFFGVADDHYVDVVACLKRDTIFTVKGERELIFEEIPDAEMGTADGLTSHVNGRVIIKIKESALFCAKVGDGRARNTVAHEIGHAVMHDRIGMPRRALENVRPKWIRPFESAEHQAKVFAAAFLINDRAAEGIASPEDLSLDFGISLESATIYINEHARSYEREKSKERVNRMAEEFIREVKGINRGPKFLDSPCTQCGRRTLLPLGSKFMCYSCESVFDHYQDGDPSC